MAKIEARQLECKGLATCSVKPHIVRNDQNPMTQVRKCMHSVTFMLHSFS